MHKERAEGCHLGQQLDEGVDVGVAAQLGQLRCMMCDAHGLSQTLCNNNYTYPELAKAVEALLVLHVQDAQCAILHLLELVVLCECLQDLMQDVLWDGAVDVDALDYLGVASDKVKQLALDLGLVVRHHHGFFDQVEREIIACRVYFDHPVLAHVAGRVSA